VDSHPRMTPVAEHEVRMETLLQAGEDCRLIGLRYIGEQAVTQVNISGDAGLEAENTVHRVNELIAQQATEAELKVGVEEELRALVMAQREVYEALKKDSYARFVLTDTMQELNANENLKRLLAAEKLEGEVRSTSTETKNSNLSNSGGGSGAKDKDGSGSKKRLSDIAVRRSTGSPVTPTASRLEALQASGGEMTVVISQPSPHPVPVAARSSTAWGEPRPSPQAGDAARSTHGHHLGGETPAPRRQSHLTGEMTAWGEPRRPTQQIGERTGLDDQAAKTEIVVETQPDADQPIVIS